MASNQTARSGSGRSRNRSLSFLALIGCSALTPVSAFGQSEVTWFLDWLAPTAVKAISGDGKVMGGHVGNGPYTNGAVWSASAGLLDIGTNGGIASSIEALNHDGSIGAGYVTTAGFSQNAMRWTRGGGIEDLGTLGPTGYGWATGISADGKVVVGVSDADAGDSVDGRRAFRWVEGSTGGAVGNEQMHALGTLGGQYSVANGVSADGEIVVGESDNGMGAVLAYRWTAGTGMISIGHLGGGNSFAKDISADGGTIVGMAHTADHLGRAYRWREATGMEDLGVLAGYGSSTAYSVSDAGDVVVGVSYTAGNSAAFRWSEETQMQSVADWLAAGKVAVPAWVKSSATGVSGDGQVVVGNAAGADGVLKPYIARVTPTVAGVIDPSVYAASLFDATSSAYAAQQLAFLPLNGAHHQPLLTQHSLTAESCFWTTGDIGYYGNGRNASAGLVEAGICHDFASNVRAGIGLGKSGSRQDLALGGSNRADGQYIVGEIDWAPEGTPLLISGTALFGSWGTTTRRGYANGAGVDYSEGSTQARVAMMRARIDWIDAATLGKTSINPWAALTLSQTGVDGYTEAGGAFPARFDAQSHTAAELRIGLTAKTPVTEIATLSTTIEAVHRFDGTGPGASGETLGLFDFNLPGQAQSQTWLRVGADLELEFAPNAAGSLSLHASTNGQDATLSGAAGLRFTF